MKRIILFIPLVFLALGAFAQTPATVTVSGKLEAVNARIAVKSGGNTYFVFGIDRLIGFVAGLNEGAQVSLEGYEAPGAASEDRYLWVSKLSFNGKDYDLSPRFAPDQDRRGPAGPPRGGHRGMPWGYGHW